MDQVVSQLIKVSLGVKEAALSYLMDQVVSVAGGQRESQGSAQLYYD